MAKYKSLIKFKGIKEERTFEPDEEIEMTVKRAEEINKAIEKSNNKVALERIEDGK